MVFWWYSERLRSGSTSKHEETDLEPDTSPSLVPSPSLSKLPLVATASTPQLVMVACGVRAPCVSIPAGVKQVAAAPSPSAPMAGMTAQRQQQRWDDSAAAGG